VIFCTVSGSNCIIFSLNQFEKLKMFLDLGCGFRGDGGNHCHKKRDIFTSGDNMEGQITNTVLFVLV